MNKFTKFFTCLFLIILLSSGLTSVKSQDIDPVLASRLQAAIDSVRIFHNVKGVSACVLIPDSIPGGGMWVGTSGVSHGNVPITPGTKFCIGSITKMFISVLMLRLAELNVLSLEDQLDKWLPSFQYVDSTITIRQLLNHTSGVFDFQFYPGFSNTMNGDTARHWTPEEILTTFMLPPYAPPGDTGVYANTNYLLAGMIIKAATDTSVSAKLRELIFNPVNLTNTFLSVEEPLPDTTAHFWRNGVDWGNYPITSWFSTFWTAGSVFSTAENLVRFNKALFNLQIINQSSFNQMFSFGPVNLFGQFVNYGLGLIRTVINPPGITLFGHHGGLLGYLSDLQTDSALGFTVCAIINQQPTQQRYFMEAMGNAIFNWWPSPNNIHPISSQIPEKFNLQQNYPNPFNPVTNIKFQISSKVIVKLTVFDILGRELETLVSEELKPGTYETEWDGTNYSSGLYFYRFEAEEFIETKKMILVK